MFCEEILYIYIYIYIYLKYFNFLDNGYNNVNKLVLGRGYWLRFSKKTSVIIENTSTTNHIIPPKLYDLTVVIKI